MAEDELKSERVQLLMTPSELKVIDDWSFENRIRGRAEAMRRLCQLGLAVNEILPALSETHKQQIKAAKEFASKFNSLTVEEKRNNDLAAPIFRELSLELLKAGRDSFVSYHHLKKLEIFYRKFAVDRENLDEDAIIFTPKVVIEIIREVERAKSERDGKSKAEPVADTPVKKTKQTRSGSKTSSSKKKTSKQTP